jgi:hypothetical protein
MWWLVVPDGYEGRAGEEVDHHVGHDHAHRATARLGEPTVCAQNNTITIRHATHTHARTHSTTDIKRRWFVRSDVAEAEKKAGAPVHDDLAHALADVAQVERRGAGERADEELEQERRQLLLSPNEKQRSVGGQESKIIYNNIVRRK